MKFLIVNNTIGAYVQSGGQRVNVVTLPDNSGRPGTVTADSLAALVAARGLIPYSQVAIAKARKIAALNAASETSLAAGIALVIPSGSVPITLAAGPSDHAKLTGLAALLREMQEAAGNPASYDQGETHVIDAAGAVHTLSIADLRTILIAYGQQVLAATATLAGKLASVAAATTVDAVDAIS